MTQTAKGRTGLNPLAYMGVEAPTPPQFMMEPRPPTPKDAIGVNIGTLWLDISNFSLVPPQPPVAENIWMLVSLLKGVATWVNFAGGAGNLITLTGDVGGPVPPTFNNIFTLGTAGQILVTGNPGISTLTWSLDGAVANQYTEDVGVAVPVANNLNIFGAHGINTLGAGSTVTVAINNAITLGDLADITGLDALTAQSGNIEVVNGEVLVGNTTATAAGSFIRFEKSRALGVITSGDALGNITFSGFDGTNYINGAAITSVNSGTVAANRIAGDLTFFTHRDAVEVPPVARMNISSTGIVSVNASDDPLWDLVVNRRILVGDIGVGTGGDAIDVKFQSNLPTPLQGFINMLRHNAAGGAPVIGDRCGTIQWAGWDGVNYIGAGSIVVDVGGTAVGVDRIPGDMKFLTHKDAVLGVPTLRLTITANGNFVFQTPDAGPALTSIATYGQAVGGVNAAVLIDNTGVMGTVVSSRRYKDNINDMGSYSDALMSLRPVTFNFKKDSPVVKSVGLIAEEVNDIFPDIVNHDKDGNPESVRYHDLPVMLLNELQKLSNRVKQLEERCCKCK